VVETETESEGHFVFYVSRTGHSFRILNKKHILNLAAFDLEATPTNITTTYRRHDKWDV
jgi:hypothetical protein